MAAERTVLLAAVAGCYAPTASTGAPCDDRAICPSGQVCVAGRCEPEGTHVPDAPDHGVDASTDAPGDAPVMLGPWSAPSVVGILPGDSKTDPSFTPDRLTVVFASNNDLFLATRPAIGMAFTITALTALNTMAIEKSPEITADGTTIYFASNPDGDFDIFVSRLVGGAWQTPAKVPGWDGAGNEQDVAIAPDELTAFVGIGGDLRRATRASKTAAWSAPASLGIAWGAGATSPSITAAGDVYFHASNPRDLFVARTSGSSYAAPVPVTELNTGGRDAAPFVSADDRHLMFDRDGELMESAR